MTMSTGSAGPDVRFASQGDLPFVSRDRYLPSEVVARKIALDEVIVAEVEGERVGYLRLEYLWSTVPYVALIDVLEAHRGRGIGKALLAFAVDFLRGRGHAALYSSFQSNEPAPRAWHLHVGFEPAGAIAGLNEDGSDELFVRLPL